MSTCFHSLHRRGLLSKTRKTARSGLQNSNGSSENRLKVQTIRAAAKADDPKLERQHVSRYRASTWSINRDSGTSGEDLGALKTSNVSRLVAIANDNRKKSHNNKHNKRIDNNDAINNNSKDTKNMKNHNNHDTDTASMGIVAPELPGREGSAGAPKGLQF